MTEPIATDAEFSQERPNLLIRFRRGDEWTSGRLCSVGVNGLFIATDTPARVGEIVELEISMLDTVMWRSTGLERRHVLLSGVIVLSRNAAHHGPPGFSAHLRYRNRTVRRELVIMLQAARDDRRLRPPPQRSEARYPISWPIVVKVGHRRCRMSALDVSRQGMFVGGAAPLLRRGERVEVAFSVDSDGPPIRGTTHVARTIATEFAAQHKLRRGMGLRFCELGQRNRRQYESFVRRVSFRSTKHVVVGAMGIRLNHLVTELSAVGYAVTRVTDATRLFAVCSDELNTPDLVIFDTSFRDKFSTAINSAQRTLTTRLIASAEFDQPFAEPVRALADSILAPAESAWLDQGWNG